MLLQWETSCISGDQAYILQRILCDVAAWTHLCGASVVSCVKLQCLSPIGRGVDQASTFRLGPLVTILVGVLLNAGGYLAIWLATSHYYNPPYWILLIFSLVACNGQTWFETAALVTCVQNFETERYEA